MSILSHKRILVIGERDEYVSLIANELSSHGSLIEYRDCAQIDQTTVHEISFDLIILNHLHEGEFCLHTLELLHGEHIHKRTPICVLVKDDPKRIEHALMLGAADYFLPDETVDDIVKKIRLVLGEPESFIDESVIDVPVQAENISTAGIRVFLIEDDPLLRNLLSIRFEQASFPFAYSSDGKDAILEIQKFRPDIIILDIMLPGIDGLDLLEEIRKNDALGNLPVIIFSNRDGQDERRRAASLGVRGFYVKAMTDLSELVSNIEKYATKHVER